MVPREVNERIAAAGIEEKQTIQLSLLHWVTGSVAAEMAFLPIKREGAKDQMDLEIVVIVVVVIKDNSGELKLLMPVVQQASPTRHKCPQKPILQTKHTHHRRTEQAVFRYQQRRRPMTPVHQKHQALPLPHPRTRLLRKKKKPDKQCWLHERRNYGR